MQHRLVCRSCEETFAPGLTPLVCPACQGDEATGRIEVVVDPSTVDTGRLPFGDGAGETTMWRYREVLPLLGDRVVSLGEGWTPLTPAGHVSTWAEADVLVKNETTNPTWSFKDRFNSLLLSNAVADGYDRIVVSSTGNHGASTAAYASVAGCDRTIVLLHPESERPARIQVQAYGAQAVVTSADGRIELLDDLVDRGWYPTTGTGEMSTGIPYGYEAYKTIAFEIAEQLPTTPTAVTVPTGSGDGLYGIWKGFRELVELGVIERPPRMIAVQPTELAPLVDAFEGGIDAVDMEPGTPPLTTSTASHVVGIHALEALDESDGAAVRVERELLLEAIRRTAADGLMLELASALATAGVKRAVETSVIDPESTVVCVGTGAGVKWPDALEPIFGVPPTIEPTWAALNGALDGSIDASVN